ncbi:GrpB family protein [Solibacillus daqui]|uniref:GrpB family protein n=1 Tax=Solibacillus daqui TaxID=2912187 RepID=UPI0023664A57|nr:GrpB family protein [Solibacillus daqui]
MRKVEISSHKREWSLMFEEESKQLKNILGTLVINVFHIGSTAIPNIQAKPVIDILIEVTCLSEVDKFNYQFEQLGYRVHGENGIPNRRYFSKGGNNRTHHVHIFEQGNPEITRHLAFRDYMIAHPKEAQNYSQLKQTLADKYPNSIEMYIEGKNDYIKTIDYKAAKWEKLTNCSDEGFNATEIKKN